MQKIVQFQNLLCQAEHKFHIGHKNLSFVSSQIRGVWVLNSSFLLEPCEINDLEISDISTWIEKENKILPWGQGKKNAVFHRGLENRNMFKKFLGDMDLYNSKSEARKSTISV